MSEIEDDKVRFEPQQLRIACPEKDCGEVSYISERNVKQGNSWACRDYGSILAFALGVTIARSDEA